MIIYCITPRKNTRLREEKELRCKTNSGILMKFREWKRVSSKMTSRKI
jgi:hypothetical protein